MWAALKGAVNAPLCAVAPFVGMSTGSMASTCCVGGSSASVVALTTRWIQQPRLRVVAGAAMAGNGDLEQDAACAALSNDALSLVSRLLVPA